MNSLAVEEGRIGLMKRNLNGCQIIINVSNFKRSSNKLHQITTYKDTLDNWNATRPVGNRRKLIDHPNDYRWT